MFNSSGFHGKVVFAGVGNVLKGDDGFGSILAQRIRGKVSFKVFDTGTAPENYLGVVVREKPDTIIYADTADFGGEPGDVRLLDSSELKDSSFYLTHNTSLKLLFEFLSMDEVTSDVWILCCQPGSMALGESLSTAVENSLRSLTERLISVFPAPEKPE